MSINPSQCRAGRALLNWSQSQLSEAAGVARATLAEFESGKRTPIANNMEGIQRALETAGVQFLEGGETAGGAGVALQAGSK